MEKTPTDYQERQLSRDEMNLAEFPITVLSTRANPSLKTLEFSDTVKGKNGETVERHWIITGADKFGLPTSSDDEILLGLLKLTVNEGMKNRKVYFTRYELLKILRWSTEGRSYTRLQRALDRLSGVRIKATNAFYDNDNKSHCTKNFGLIDAYEINSSRDGDLKNSFFQWSEVIFKSFQVGFIKKLDLEFFLTLRSAVTKRLYRYLDKHFWYRSTVEVEVFTLAHEKIGISRNYRYASSLRQQLDPALEELKERGFLRDFHYSGRGKTTKLLIHAAVGAKSVKKLSQDSVPSASSCKTEESTVLQDVVVKMIERGLSEKQALRLIEGKSEEVLLRIKEVIAHFDGLKNRASKLISRSPVGFLYKAIENVHTFRLPSDQQQPLVFARGSQKEEPSQKVSSVPYQQATPSRTVVPDESDTIGLRGAGTSKRISSSKKSENLEATYLVERHKRIAHFRGSMLPEELIALSQEVTKALVKLRPLISASRFEEAIEHGIAEKIARRYQVPSFDEWKNTLS